MDGVFPNRPVGRVYRRSGGIGEQGGLPPSYGLPRLPDGRTRYTATVIHQDEAGKRAHEAMGFYEGWGAALDQLVELG